MDSTEGRCVMMNDVSTLWAFVDRETVRFWLAWCQLAHTEETGSAYMEFVRCLDACEPKFVDHVQQMSGYNDAIESLLRSPSAGTAIHDAFMGEVFSAAHQWRMHNQSRLPSCVGGQ